jgi:hypothetical protein
VCVCVREREGEREREREGERWIERDVGAVSTSFRERENTIVTANGSCEKSRRACHHTRIT